MRNLYRLLGLDPNATPDQIRAALSTVSDADKVICESILLDPAKRAAYDHAYWSMIRVAWIRQSLNVTFTPGWPRTNLVEWNIPLQEKARSTNQRGAADTNTSSDDSVSKSNDVSEGTAKLLLRIVAVIILLIVFSAMCDDKSREAPPYRNSGASPTTSPTDANQAPMPPDDTFNEPEVEMPEHGEVFIRRGASKHKFVFQEITSPMIVKVVEANTKRVVRSVFARAGEDLTIGVPEGQFVVYLKVGQKWFGDKHQFGPFSSCSKLDNEYQMPSSNGVIDVWTIRLERQQDGNLTQSSVSSTDFDELN